VAALTPLLEIELIEEEVSKPSFKVRPKETNNTIAGTAEICCKVDNTEYHEESDRLSGSVTHTDRFQKH
jgi:hypothetical protein